MDKRNKAGRKCGGLCIALLCVVLCAAALCGIWLPLSMEEEQPVTDVPSAELPGKLPMVSDIQIPIGGAEVEMQQTSAANITGGDHWGWDESAISVVQGNTFRISGWTTGTYPLVVYNCFIDLYSTSQPTFSCAAIDYSLYAGTNATQYDITIETAGLSVGTHILYLGGQAVINNDYTFCDCFMTYSFTVTCPHSTSTYGGTSGVHTKCASCGVTLTSSHSYKVDSGVQYSAATCTAPRYNYKRCVCGYNPQSSSNIVATGSPNGHSYSVDSGVQYQAATCTTNRFNYKKCSVCAYNPQSADYIVEVANTATGHSYSVDSGVQYQAATCTTNRFNYKKCSTCGHNLQSSSYIVEIANTALGHAEPTDWTTETNGVTRYKNCTRSDCGVRLSTQHWLTLVKGTGIDSVSGDNWYDANTNATISCTVMTGYSFSDWTGSALLTANSNSITMDAPKSYMANATPNPYTYNITYISSNNVPLGTTTVTYNFDTTNTIIAPEMAGYTTPEAQEVAWDNVNAKTITFIYVPITYKITFTLNGGINYGSALKEYIVEDETIPLGTPDKTGYLFGGWYTDAEFVTPITEIPKGSTGDVALFAKWTAITYTIIYHPNETAGYYGTATGATASSTHTYDISQALNANGFSRNGYTFAGWATVEGDKTVVYEDLAEVLNLADTQDAEVNLYAVWQIVIYTANLNPNNGEVSSETVTYDIENGSAVLPTLTRDGYTFIGWRAGTTVGNWVDAEAVLLTPGTAIPSGYYGDDSTPPTHVTLVAVWDVVSYTITYKDEDNLTVLETKTYTIEDTFDLFEASHATYRYNGWLPDADSGNWDAEAVEPYIGEITGMWGDVTLIVQWQKGTMVTYVIIGQKGGTIDRTEELVQIDGEAMGCTPAADAGFHYAQWYTDEACTIPVDPAWIGEGNILKPVADEGVGEATYYVLFNHTMYTLTIAPTVDEAQAARGTMSFIYHVTVNPVAADLTESDVWVAVKAGESVVIDIPEGTYNIAESAGWNWRYEMTQASATAVSGTADADVTVSLDYDTMDDRWLNYHVSARMADAADGGDVIALSRPFVGLCSMGVLVRSTRQTKRDDDEDGSSEVV